MRCKPSEKTKLKHKKGLWSPDEDQKLRDYIVNYGHGCWSAVPVNAGLERNGKSCRLRWINYLRPGLKRGAFSIQEEETILTLHGLLGNKWSIISQRLPGRTDNEIKNHWHSYLKKQVAKSGCVEAEPKSEYTNSNTGMAESSSSYMNSLTRNPSFDSSDSANQSYVNADQPVLQTQINKLPKILFADWLSLEEFHGHESLACKDGVSNGLNYQETPVNGSLANEASTESSQSNYPNEDMFHTQMKIDQLFNFSGGDLNIEDFLYI